MKFTKLLVVFLVLSMLLVSCNGVGNGAMTSEPEGTVEAPGDTAEPFGTIPSSTDVTPEYVYYGDELIDLATLPCPQPALCIETITYSHEFLSNACNNNPDSFVIQFTATDYARMYVGDDNKFFSHEARIGGSIRGTVDAVYATGSDVSIEVGSEIDLGVHYMIDVEKERFYLATTEASIFRKGYSYILLGVFYEGMYSPMFTNVYQIASAEHTRAFYASLGVLDVYDYGYNDDDLAKVFKNCPPVKPTRLED